MAWSLVCPTTNRCWESKNAFSDDGSLVDDELTERMESMVDALVKVCVVI